MVLVYCLSVVCVINLLIFGVHIYKQGIKMLDHVYL